MISELECEINRVMPIIDSYISALEPHAGYEKELVWLLHENNQFLIDNKINKKLRNAIINKFVI